MRHATHRWFAQVQWLIAGPIVIAGGQPLHGARQIFLFLLGLIATSLATHGARWAQTAEVTPGPGWRTFKVIKAVTPRWEFEQRLFLLIAGWVVTALASMVGSARALVHRAASRLVGRSWPIMHSIVSVPFAGLSASAVTMGLALVLAPLGLTLPQGTSIVVGIAVALGWWGGIFCDLLTDQGASLLYPFSRRRIRLLNLRTSPPKWQRGPDGKIPDRPNPVMTGEAMFNGLLAATALYFAVTILAVA